MAGQGRTSEGLERHLKRAGQIWLESCITRGADLRSSIWTQSSDAMSVPTCDEPRCDESECMSVCISNFSSFDVCSSLRNVSSAREEATRISSSE